MHAPCRLGPHQRPTVITLPNIDTDAQSVVRMPSTLDATLQSACSVPSRFDGTKAANCRAPSSFDGTKAAGLVAGLSVDKIESACLCEASSIDKTESAVGNSRANVAICIQPSACHPSRLDDDRLAVRKCLQGMYATDM